MLSIKEKYYSKRFSEGVVKVWLGRGLNQSGSRSACRYLDQLYSVPRSVLEGVDRSHTTSYVEHCTASQFYYLVFLCVLLLY